MANKPVINLDQLEFQVFQNGERFESNRASASQHIGGSKLGYTVVVLKPGKRAWPYHSHFINEEMFFILEGEGTLRHAGEEYAVRSGDFIAAPPDPQQPHQIVNTSKTELKYMCVSTREDPEICLYPDSDKYGVFKGDFRRMDGPDSFFVLSRKESGVDYWDGED